MTSEPASPPRPPGIREARRDPSVVAMEESVEKGNGSEGTATGPAPGADEIGELRRLLLVAEEAQVSRIQQRLDDPEIYAEDVSRVLPEALLLRSAKDDDLSRALQPTVEKAIVTSVRRDPQTLVDALFPVMGPAIRKAIASALASMVESFSQTLEHSFSVRGLKWRLEAWRTGKPLAEVILLRTLVYRVEQVFLIHRESGLLLQHVSASARGVQDADMVSGMLTAIRDFVHDSFGGREGDSLDAFQVGEFSVWIEPGPLATLAAVIRGNAPKGLRPVFTEAIERIHAEQGTALREFEGDAAPFERSRPHLEACLRAELQKSEPAPAARKHRAVAFLRAAVVAALVALGVWIVFAARRNRRWESYLGSLAAKPGLVVTESGRRGGKYFVNGLRDPLAADPVAMLGVHRLAPEGVESDWKPYQALAPEIVAVRARQVLDAPASVILQVRGGALVAAGSAPRGWIEEARDRVRSIAGITGYDDRALADAESIELESLRRRIEGRVILFALGSAEVSAAGDARIRETAGDARALALLAAKVGRGARLEVVGRGDSVGTEEVNLGISSRRADRVAAALERDGVGALTLAPSGVGSTRPIRPEVTEKDRELNRSVSFRVVLADGPGQESPRR